MAFLALPIDSTPDAFTVIELEGEDYGFRTYWNERNGSWHCSIFDASQNPLVYNKRVGTYTLLSRNVPAIPGKVIAVPVDDLDISDPGENDLGVRILIMYEESNG